MLLPRVLPAILCLSASLTLFSCEDTSEKTQAAIIGHWELTKALRNDKETGTLEGVYFDFGADGMMQTNLPVGVEQPVEYDVDQTTIVQKTAQKIRYQAVAVEDSVLILKLEMRGMNFEMQLHRATPPTDSLETPLSEDSQQ